MKTWQKAAVTAAALGLFAGGAWAQDNGGTPPAGGEQPPAGANPPPPSPADGVSDFMVNALKERLGLSDAQTEQVRGFLKEATEQTSAIRKAQEEKISGILTDEQKPKFEEVRQMLERGGRMMGGGGPGGPGGPGGRGGGGPFGMGRFFDQAVEDMKNEVGLSEEQVKQAKTIFDEAQQNGQKMFEEMRGQGFGGFDMNKIRETFESQWNDVKTKLGGILTDEQKPKFEAYAKQREEMINGFMSRFGMGGRRGGDGGGDGGGGRTPEERMQRRTQRALEALALDSEEEQVVEPILKQILEAQVALDQKNRENAEAIQNALKDEDLTSEGIGPAVEKARAERDELEKKISGLQPQLRELLTPKQEAAMVAQGVLR